MQVSVYNPDGITVDMIGNAPIQPPNGASSVVRTYTWTAPSDLGPVNKPANFGVQQADPTKWLVHNVPVIDSVVGGMRFDVSSQSSQMGCGMWYGNYSPDLSVRFGANTEHFVCWEQMFDQVLIDTFYNAIGGGPTGIKLIIISTGDVAGKAAAGSCTELELVTVTYGMHKFPIGYNDCNTYAGFYEPTAIGSGDQYLQNALKPGAKFSDCFVGGSNLPPGCFALVAGKWMRFQVGITLGARDDTLKQGVFTNSRYRLWGAIKGAPWTPIVDWNPSVLKYFPLAAGIAADDQKYGKVWIGPYMTNKDPTQVTPTGATWYQNLTIARQFVQ